MTTPPSPPPAPTPPAPPGAVPAPLPADAAAAGTARPGAGAAAMDRRGFLRASSGGIVAIAVASALPAGCTRTYPQAAADGHTLRALSDKEYAVARAAAETLLVGVPVSAAAVAAAIDIELAAVGEPVRGDMKSAFGLLEHLTLLDGQAARFTALSPERRMRVLNGWARSRIVLRRGAYQAVRGFVYFYAFIDDATRSVTGFNGPWPERMMLPVTPIDFGVVT
jgi:hypothetical protein